MPEGLDEATLLCTAAFVLDVDPRTVLDAVDVAELAALAAEVGAVADPVDAAAHLLVRVVRARPFPRANAAIGWLAAVDLLRAHGRFVQVRTARVVALCDEIRAGSDAVAPVLRSWSTLAITCPACGRSVYALDHSRRRVQPGFSRYELVARCSFEHGAHDRAGRERPRPVPREHPQHVPILARGECGSFAVALDGRTLVVAPYCDDPVIHRVVEVGDVSPGDLLGRWDALVGRSSTVRFVPGPIDTSTDHVARAVLA